jgi:hypothetical protein
MNFSKIRFAAIFTFVVLLSTTAFSQSIVSSESFPNTFNTAGTAGTDGSFTGNQGSWTVLTSTILDAEVDVTQFTSSPNSLRLFVNNAAASATITDNLVTSPTTGLNFGACTPSSVALTYRLLPADVENGNTNFTLGVQFFNGTSWNTVQTLTSDQIFDTYGEGTAAADWATVSINVPVAYWNVNFRYRFYVIKAATTGNNSSTDLWIDDVTITATTTGPAFPDFSDATPTKIVDGGAVGGSFEVGDVYKFDNVVTAPEAIYAEVKIEAIVNAAITNLDNNAAGIAQRFQPRIRPNPQTLTADQEGYVQFAITFKKVSDNNTVFLEGLRYRHFDVDGSTTATGTGAYSFRETGWITGQSSILVNTPSDLVAGGAVVSGPPAGTSWSKVLGELDEHDGITSDPDVSFTATYGAISTVRFRLGYLFDEIGSNASYDPGAEGREYATEFGCFDLTEQTTLPVKLLSFTGSYRNNLATLNWQTVNELVFDHFELERSSDGSNFTTIVSKTATGNASYNSKQNYQHLDDLTAVNGNVFYYRLKMVDQDGRYKHSSVIMIRKDQKALNGIAVNPSPVINGMATVRFSATAAATVDFRVVDMQGRVVLQQQNKVYEGNNSVSLNNLSNLSPGVYTLQLVNGSETAVVKFAVAK